MEKSNFKVILAVFAISLLVLPAITTFNEFLTMVIMKIPLYLVIQNFIVPFEARIVAVVLNFVGIQSFPTAVSVGIGKSTIVGNDVVISWNCVGWQSFILLAITLVTGLQGSFTALERLKTIVLGITGTFLINIFRMSFFVVLAYRINQHTALIFHDYLSTMLTVIWLLFFWWFTYSYILERKGIME